MTDEKSATKIHRALLTAESPADRRRVAPRPMYLIVVGGGIPGAMIRLSAEGNHLGRSSENNVKLSDPSVSRHQAVIMIDGQRVAWLTDQGSTNGTFLNNERLVPHVAYRLDPGHQDAPIYESWMIHEGDDDLLAYTQTACLGERPHHLATQLLPRLLLPWRTICPDPDRIQRLRAVVEGLPRG